MCALSDDEEGSVDWKKKDNTICEEEEHEHCLVRGARALLGDSLVQMSPNPLCLRLLQVNWSGGGQELEGLRGQGAVRNGCLPKSFTLHLVLC